MTTATTTPIQHVQLGQSLQRSETIRQCIIVCQTRLEHQSPQSALVDFRAKVGFNERCRSIGVVVVVKHDIHQRPRERAVDAVRAASGARIFIEPRRWTLARLEEAVAHIEPMRCALKIHTPTPVRRVVASTVPEPVLLPGAVSTRAVDAKCKSAVCRKMDDEQQGVSCNLHEVEWPRETRHLG